MCCSFALALTAFLAAQGDPAGEARGLIERLRSDRIEQRDEAARRLRDLGERARLELERASGDRDPEVAGRARHVLRLIEVRGRLTPSLLQIMPSVDERLASGEGRDWARAFFEAVESEGIQAEDLGGFFPEAIRGLESLEEKYALLHEVRGRGLESAAPGILGLLRDEDSGVCRFAAHLILKFGWKEGAPEHVALLGSGDYAKRSIPWWALKGLDLRPVADMVLSLLESGDAEIRSSAIRAVGELGIQAAEPRLIEVLKHESSGEDALTAVASALGKLAMPGTASKVVPLLRSRGAGSRRGALSALGELGDSGPAREIASLLHDPDEAVRLAAAEALGKVGTAESVRELLEILRQEDCDDAERLGILKALVELRAMEAVSGLESLLGSESSWVRRDAISCLGDLRATEAAGKLAPFLERKDGDTDGINEQLAAIHALGRLGAKYAVPVLEPLTAEREWSLVRAMAASSLCRVGVRRSAVPLLRAVEELMSGIRSGPIDDEDADFCPLNPLNALRQPGAWGKLRKTPIPERSRGTTRDLLVRIAKWGDLTLEISESRYWKEEMWMLKSGVIRSRGGQESILDALEDLLPGEPYTFILEVDRIRVVPTRDAIDAWKCWADGEKLR